MMDDEKRDDYMLELLDRMARLETKLDEYMKTSHRTEEALEISKDNTNTLDDVRRRLDENDAKWATDRKEKQTIWVTVIAGLFTVAAAVIASLI